MTRYAKRKDENQPLVVDELRANGYQVKVTSGIGNGFADLLVLKHKIAVAVELKDKGKRKQLTDKEKEMFGWWISLGMRYIVAETTEEIIMAHKNFVKELKK